MDTSYEMYKINPDLYGSEFLADYNLVKNNLEKMALDPSNRHALIAGEQKKYVDKIFENSGISSKQ